MSQTENNSIRNLIETSLQNLRSLVDANTIIGQPIVTQDGVTIIPVSKVSFGFASGGSDIPTAKIQEPFGGGAGGGVSVQPMAFLVIQEGQVQLLSMKDESGSLDKLIQMAPQMFDKVSGLLKKDKSKDKTTNTPKATEAPRQDMQAP